MSTEPSPTGERRSTRRGFVGKSAAALAGVGAVGAVGDWLLHVPRPKPPLVLGKRLHAGDEWKLTGSVDGHLNFRGHGALETPTVRLVTQHDGSEARVALERTAPIGMRGKLLRIWLRVEERGAASLREISVQVGSGNQAFESYAYQSVVLVDDLASYDREYLVPGEWVSLTICPASIASATVGQVDYAAVRDFAISVSDDRTGPAAVQFGGMQVIDASPAFPRGVVTFAFDDGLLTAYTHAKPVLDAFGYPATTYAIHSLVGEQGYMTEEQLRTARTDGWEIGMHANTTRVHNAPHGLVGVPSDVVLADWRNEREWLASLDPAGSRDLALPQGFFDRRIARLARSYGGFDTVRTSNFRSIETLPVADPLRLRTIPYDVTVPVGPSSQIASIEWRIDQLAAYGGWLILSFHEVVERRSYGSEIELARFRRIVEHVARRRVPVRTVSGVRKAAGADLQPLPPRYPPRPAQRA